MIFKTTYSVGITGSELFDLIGNQVTSHLNTQVSGGITKEKIKSDLTVEIKSNPNVKDTFFLKASVVVPQKSLKQAFADSTITFAIDFKQRDILTILAYETLEQKKIPTDNISWDCDPKSVKFKPGKLDQKQSDKTNLVIEFEFKLT